MTGSEAQPAATVVLVRDAEPDLEVLLVRRGERGAFGGIWAFPGGRVEPGDEDLDRRGDELAAARRAAARETAEEVGLILDDRSFVPLAHWMPPRSSPRRFSTWFFLAVADAADVVIDEEEIVEHRWYRPAAAIAARDAGEITLVPPTWITLDWLAAAGSATAALDAARGTEPERFATHIVERADGRIALWQGDAGYEDSDADRPGARHRLWMGADAPWRYERGS